MPCVPPYKFLSRITMKCKPRTILYTVNLSRGHLHTLIRISGAHRPILTLSENITGAQLLHYQFSCFRAKSGYTVFLLKQHQPYSPVAAGMVMFLTCLTWSWLLACSAELFALKTISPVDFRDRAQVSWIVYQFFWTVSDVFQYWCAEHLISLLPHTNCILLQAK